MKKLLFVSSFCIAAMFVVNAQSSRFGFTAGTSIANYKTKYPGITFSNDSKAGLTAGILVDIPAGNNLSIQPALNYVQKGAQWEDAGEKGSMNINCIEVPVNFLYNTNGGSGTFFVGAGPSFAFNMSGKMKHNDGTGEVEEDIEIGNDKDNDDIKSLDAGGNFLAGYRFSNGFFLSAGYNLGLSNLSLYSDDEESIKSSYFSIKIGFMLKGKK